ncbi:nitroreductase family protein [Paenibacillus tritici]|uniref:Nitroreductase family protein n=1 Tax=Paenibacillus tritici TaxID=1873425 RepID=A0ABX2DUT5_9BACL|nr:nitroreductase family protein [Paenibacillus tritici]NQX48463.1 nitroreductase family protein [Paenibacillus tritici]QUL56692.1 nitroreductase family protein [Paenibacillus tritici]
MKDVFTTVRERRTIRRFSAAPVEQERIVALLNEAAGLYEAEGTPHWRCLYFGTPDSREKLAESMIAKVTGSRLGKLLPAPMTDLLKKQITGTPAHVIFIAESAGTERERDENYAAVCSIMQTVQLLGWEQGLGMLWYSDPMILSESFYKLIGWREGERFAGILEIGYFDKAPRGRKRTPAERSWTTIGEGGSIHTVAAPFSEQNIQKLLNEAVWAPNDGMREPWRFIYVTGDKTEAAGKLLFSEEAPSPPFLLVVAREEADPHKQDEDYAAVCSLIQNFQLLAQSEGWHLRRRIPEWVYDRKRCESFGLRPLERIVAVLEAGEHQRYSNSGFPPHAVKITIN